MKNKRALWTGLALLVVITAVVAIVTVVSRPNDPTTTTLRLRWLHQAQFAGIYVADKDGLFKEEGLSVTINPGGPGISFMQLVGSGSEAFGICGAAQVIEARDKGVPVVALAVIYQGNPNIFFAKTSSGIRSVKDWPGKTVAYQQGYDIEYVYRAMVENAGVDESAIKTYPAKFDMGPFFRDEVDVWAGYRINQPLAAEEKGFEITRFFPEDYGVKMAGDCLFTTEQMVREHPELCQKMVNAVLTGWRRSLQNKPHAVDLVLEFNPAGDRTHETNMLNEVEKLVYPGGQQMPLGTMTREQWQQMIDMWTKYGGITKNIAPEDCFAPQFVEAYHAHGN